MYYKCIFGFVSHEDKVYFYGEIIQEEEYNLLTSSEKRNFKCLDETQTKRIKSCLH